jgi:surface protein
MNCWDTSGITDMSYLFSSDTFRKKDYHINEPIDCWDVSKVSSMKAMFEGALNFNQYLNSWDVSSVTDMSFMFENAKSFNQPLDQWVTGKIKSMSAMFQDAESFDQPLGIWDVGSVMDISYMFFGALSFNQPLNSWNVSSVSSMGAVFQDASSFNQPLSSWNISSVIDMYSMFHGATSFNQNLCQWFDINEEMPVVLFMFFDSNCSNKSDPDFITKTSYCNACSNTKVRHVVYLLFLSQALICSLYVVLIVSQSRVRINARMNLFPSAAVAKAVALNSIQKIHFKKQYKALRLIHKQQIRCMVS